MFGRSTMLALVVLVAAGGTAAADESRFEPAVRLAGAIGSLEEITWAAPGVEVAGTLSFGSALLGVQLGYSPVDNHNFLSDGLLARVAVTAGLRASESVRLRGIAGVEYVAFHADPDVLADHPGVDLLARRDAFVPTAGVEVTKRIRPALWVGLFGRAGATSIELFRDGNDSDSAHLFLFGVVFELALH